MRKISLIIVVLLCGVVACLAAAEKKPTFQSLLTKIVTDTKTQGYSNQYIKNNAKAVILEAITDPNDLRALSRCRNVLNSSLVKWAKQRKERADNRAFLLHIRKAGTDTEILAVMQRLVIDTDWIGDPNAFLPL